jgi:hypothetical protein
LSFVRIGLSFRTYVIRTNVSSVLISISFYFSHRQDSGRLQRDPPRDRVGRGHQVGLQTDLQPRRDETRRRIRPRSRHDRKRLSGSNPSSVILKNNKKINLRYLNKRSLLFLSQFKLFLWMEYGKRQKKNQIGVQLK